MGWLRCTSATASSTWRESAAAAGRAPAGSSWPTPAAHRSAHLLIFEWLSLATA
eukprot:CAMPEP_0198686152 /NCGR_PEP_ID=MMETSP1468-20131203/14549_1 /TAXON_ID=1461545 /ORGANISM="Mantoniella sp, Strain CCMP1436" /LENGTH=53 /DNA_ID=CAMNT_0044432075 /DNA_START=108 /DNA_END=265 /DNA_ORIENTATION=+